MPVRGTPSARRLKLRDKGRRLKIDYSEVRRLLRLGAAAALGTHSASVEGYPFASSLPYVLDGACRPLFLISGLAEHTRNLLADARASLLVLEGEGGRLDQARVTLLGRVLPATPDDELQARYLRYRPEAADYLTLRDFRFFRMEPEKARFIGGFGRMGWVEACPPPLPLDARTEAGLLDVLGKLAPSGVSVLGLDFEGLDVRICGVFRRFALQPSAPGVDGLLAAAADTLCRAESPPSGGAGAEFA